MQTEDFGVREEFAEYSEPRRKTATKLLVAENVDGSTSGGRGKAARQRKQQRKLLQVVRFMSYANTDQTQSFCGLPLNGIDAHHGTKPPRSTSKPISHLDSCQ